MTLPAAPAEPNHALFAPLTEQGLNLHAVFDLNALPPEVLTTLRLSDEERGRFRQLILIGHLGRDFWAAVQRRGLHGAHPMDQFASDCTADWLTRHLQPQGAVRHWHLVFPGSAPVGLQRLGLLAGWHHPSPFWVGVDAEWGSWFAYRAVVLADTALPLTPRRDMPSPCDTCVDKPCIRACPAGALASDQSGPWRLTTCLDERKRPGTACLDRCLARNACPVGEPYRYADGQIAYHYLHSMRAIREHH